LGDIVELMHIKFTLAYQFEGGGSLQGADCSQDRGAGDIVELGYNIFLR